jgi:hypothetical protein
VLGGSAGSERLPEAGTPGASCFACWISWVSATYLNIFWRLLLSTSNVLLGAVRSWLLGGCLGETLAANDFLRLAHQVTYHIIWIPNENPMFFITLSSASQVLLRAIRLWLLGECPGKTLAVNDCLRLAHQVTHHVIWIPNEHISCSSRY